MELNKKAAYLQGLVDGLGVDESTKEGKIIKAMAALLGEMADAIAAMDEDLTHAYDQINDLSEELEDLEADLYEDDEDDEEPEEEEEDTEEDDNDDDEHRVLSKRYAEEVSAWFEREKPYLREDLRLTDLQRIFPISRSYLSQLFNRELGQSFSDYVNQFRIEESKRLMDAEPNASIQEIAERSGFHSISTFRRAFQKCTGMIPSEYKNNK